MQIRILEETNLIESAGWTVRVRPPIGLWNGRVVLLLHGWTGDENIMWIFARKVPLNSWIVSPRGPLESPDGGYAWAVSSNGQRPNISPFLENASELVSRLPKWVPDYTPQTRLDVIGFSQGAAMVYALCLQAALVKAAPLAGYLPPGFSEHLNGRDFSALQMFIAHNSDDQMVPVEESKNAARLFKAHGAKVEYCESTGGHKLNSACFNSLDAFLIN